MTQAPSVDGICRWWMDIRVGGSASEAVQAFRAAIDLLESQGGDMITARIGAHHGLGFALRDAGRPEQSIGAALTAITPADPLPHKALSVSFQHGGHVPQTEAAPAPARVLKWKIQLQSPPGEPPPDHRPPAQVLIAHYPPAEEPPARHPPAKEPPGEDPPPKQEPPAKEPPVQDPPSRDNRL